MSGPNIRNAAGANSTTSAAVRASTSLGSLSSAHGSVVDGFTLTGLAYLGGGSGKADNGVVETTVAAENPILITQTR
uniref:Uncharacterized protein n=1 Tax=Romanomermis culicivorax TaxID=13658 RepID=A0A915L0T5_ROMCU